MGESEKQRGKPSVENSHFYVCVCFCSQSRICPGRFPRWRLLRHFQKCALGMMHELVLSFLTGESRGYWFRRLLPLLARAAMWLL